MTTREQMTIHKALSELKTIDNRIASAMKMTYVMAVKHPAEKINGVSVKDFTDKMKANYQKVTDLMARRDAIKRAVVLSNATTKVRVGDKEYTVAEAIEMKNKGVEFKKTLLHNISYAYKTAQAEMMRHSDEVLERDAEQYILSIIGAQPKDSKSSVDDNNMKALRESYIKNNKYDLLDPLKVESLMEKLEAEINEFETEVDSALSVSNALTVIEFEY